MIASKKDKDEGAMRFYPVVKDTSKVPDPKTPRKKKTRHTSNPPFEAHVGWIMDVKSHRPRTTSTSSQLSARYVGIYKYPIKCWYVKINSVYQTTNQWIIEKLGLCYFMPWAVGDGLYLAWHHFTQG